MTSIANRRHALKGFAATTTALAGIAAGLFRRRARAAHPVDGPTIVAVAGLNARVALTIGPDGGIVARVAHRGEYITDATHGPQPHPLATHAEPWKTSQGDALTIVHRTWRVEDVPRCRLCRSCLATRSHSTPDVASCVFGVDGHFRDDQAALVRRED